MKKGNSKSDRMKYSAVLFDVDGTIVSNKAVVKAVQEALRKMGVEALSDKVITDEFIGWGFRGKYKETFNASEEDVQRFIEFYWDFYIKNHAHYSPLFPSVVPVFKKLKDADIKIGIVTSKAKIEADAVNDAYNLRPYLDVYVTRKDAAKVSPAPDQLLLAAKKMWVRPQTCIFIGDQILNMQAAKSAGCTAVGVTTGCDPRHELLQAGADHVIDDLQELLEIVM